MLQELEQFHKECNKKLIPMYGIELENGSFKKFRKLVNNPNYVEVVETTNKRELEKIFYDSRKKMKESKTL